MNGINHHQTINGWYAFRASSDLGVRRNRNQSNNIWNKNRNNTNDTIYRNKNVAMDINANNVLTRNRKYRTYTSRNGTIKHIIDIININIKCNL